MGLSPSCFMQTASSLPSPFARCSDVSPSDWPLQATPSSHMAKVEAPLKDQLDIVIPT